MRLLLTGGSGFFGRAFAPPDASTAWLLEGMRRRETVRLFTDEIRCPVWVHDLRAAVLELADGDARAVAGALNVGGPQPISRRDFGIRMLQGLGLTAGPNVIPARMEESGLVRARDVTLRSGRAGRLLKTRLRQLDEVVSLQPGAHQPTIGALATLQG